MSERRLRRSVAAVVVAGALSLAGGTAGAAPVVPTTPAPSGPATPAPTSAAQSAPAPAAPRGLTRTERAILLVTLTFIVGGGLLAAPGGGEPEDQPAPRPAITLYDDPDLVRSAVSPPPRHTGEPPPLR